MTDYDTLPTFPPLTDGQRAVLVEWAYAAGRNRKRMQGSGFSEPDFVAGLMVAFFAFSMQDKLPAGFVFGPLSGNSIFDEETEQGGAL